MNAASAPASLLRRMPVSTYTDSDIISSARKITSRSLAPAISIIPAMANNVSAKYSPDGIRSRSTTDVENRIVRMPITHSVTLMNRAKLSARITPKPVRSRPHSSIEATAAPVSPISPRPPSGTRSPLGWNDSATIVTIAVSVTMRIGMMACRSVIIGLPARDSGTRTLARAWEW